MKQRVNGKTGFNWKGPVLAIIAGIAFYGNGHLVQANPAETVIQWQSDNKSLADLSREFDILYGGLLEFSESGEKVTTETFHDTDGLQVVEIARNRELYHGAYFPSNLDAYLCLLNPELCHANQSDTGQTTYNWHNKAGSLIVLPKIDFKSVIVPRAYQKKKHDTIKSIVINDRNGCKTMDERCERYLQVLNRTLKGFMEPGYEGTILVPTATYQAELKIERADSLNTEGSMNLAKRGTNEDRNRLKQFEQQLVPEARFLMYSDDTEPLVGRSVTGQPSSL